MRNERVARHREMEMTHNQWNVTQTMEYDEKEWNLTKRMECDTNNGLTQTMD